MADKWSARVGETREKIRVETREKILLNYPENYPEKYPEKCPERFPEK